MSDAPERIWIPCDPYADPWFSIYINRPDDVEYVRADEIAKLEAERDRLRTLLLEYVDTALTYSEYGQWIDRVIAALEKGGGDE